MCFFILPSLRIVLQQTQEFLMFKNALFYSYLLKVKLQSNFKSKV